MKNVTIDGIEYTPICKGSDVRIVVLQRGWVLVGYFSKQGEYGKLIDAAVIRNWGTTKGLGELAGEGPNKATKLDPCNGVVEFHELTVVMTLSSEESLWAKHLK